MSSSEPRRSTDCGDQAVRAIGCGPGLWRRVSPSLIDRRWPAVPERAKTVVTSRAEASVHLGKAEQFVEQARSALEGSRNDAAMLNAIHAAISAADAVAVALSGRRSAEPDHRRAVDLLEEGGARSDRKGGV